jgi:hypothetical protein
MDPVKFNENWEIERMRAMQNCYPSHLGGASVQELSAAGTQGDPVNQPQHYARWAMQPIEFIAANDLPFWFANVVKYCSRYDAKDGLQDLYKARSYLEMKIRQLEGAPNWWEKPVEEQQRAAKAR